MRVNNRVYCKKEKEEKKNITKKKRSVFINVTMKGLLLEWPRYNNDSDTTHSLTRWLKFRTSLHDQLFCCVYVAMNLVMKRIIAMRNPRADNEDGNNKFSDLETTVTDKYATTSSPLTLMRLMGFFVISFMLFSVFFSLSVVLRDPPSDAAISSTTTLFQQHTQSQQQGFFLISFSQFNLSNFINNILDRINIVVHYK
jgi:hypothetical protein